MSQLGTAARRQQGWRSAAARRGGLACPMRHAIVGLVVTLIAGVSAAAESPTSPTEPSAGRTAEALATIMTRFSDFHEALPDPGMLGMSELVAFEEHESFVYAAGPLEGAPDPAGAHRWRHILLWKPSLLIIVDGRPSGTLHARSRTHDRAESDALDCLLVRSAGHNPNDSALAPAAAGGEIRVCQAHSPDTPQLELDATAGDPASSQWTIQAGAERLRLTGVVDQPGRGWLDAWAANGVPVLESRLLAAGILPHGRRGAEMLDRWDIAYRGPRRAGWDSGRVASDLRDALSRGWLAPGRAIEFGCGTGRDAIFLAQEGFDVTAIDLAPAALEQARQHAEQAGVQVRWLLADVTAPPELAPFDVVFDRGCYHGVRRDNARGYVAALRRLTRPGSRVLILAGNANDRSGAGPPRVTEQELRDDFSAGFQFVHLETTRFDSATADRQGALAWSILLERR